MQRITWLIISSLLTIVTIFIVGSYHLYSSKKQGLINNQFESPKESEYFLSQNKLSQESEEVYLIAVGDIMLSRGIDFYINKNNDWRYPFLKIADFLNNADIAFGNLEGPISNKGADTGKLYSFRADPRSIEGLLYSGFDVLSLANNHSFDYGSEAFLDTQKNLKENGIDYVGGGLTYDEVHLPVVKEVKGTKIAFLAYTNLLPQSLEQKDSAPAVAFSDKNKIVIDIQNAKSLADIVVVSFHWGDEYQTSHNFYQEDLAHFAIDSGADLIIGHHPHVVQEIEEYNGGYIAYSLGNFIFDQNFSDDTKSGLVLTAVLRNKKIEEVKTQKINFTSSFQPFFVNSLQETPHGSAGRRSFTQ